MRQVQHDLRSIAKRAGARVFTTSSTDEKLKRAKEIGADVVLNYKTLEWDRQLFVETGKRGVDVVFDSVGAATWLKSIRALKRGGRMVVIGATTGPHPQEEIAYIFWKQIDILGSTMSSQSEFRDVMKLVLRGELKPVIDTVFPLERARDAHVRMGEDELTQRGLQREAVHTPTDGQHEHRRRAVDRVAGGDLRRARLEEIRLGHVTTGVDRRLRSAQDREHAGRRSTVERSRHGKVSAARPGAWKTASPAEKELIRKRSEELLKELQTLGY